MSCKLSALSTWSFGNQDSKWVCLSPGKRFQRVRRQRRRVLCGENGGERGTALGALPAWRPRRGCGAPRAGTCHLGSPPARVGARVSVGVCPCRALCAGRRAGAGVSHRCACLYNGPEARGSCPPARQPAAPRSSERAGPHAPNGPQPPPVPRAPWGARAALHCCSCCCCRRCGSHHPPGTPPSSLG